MPITVPDGATRSAVLALVPDAEPVVGELRAVLDPTASAGVPAHVTVLYPFAAPSGIDDATVAGLRDAVSDVPAFRFRLADVGWFGTEYVWLAPDPSEPFDELTARVARAFPEHPPYGGEHEPHPHLTVGYRRHASEVALRDAADRIRPLLPVDARVDRLHLLAGSHEPGSWRTVAELPLARA
ncbi:2'-5' RNA ligase family protein [Pseudonocardia endophytica]|uniref:2'-5' RNA ligase family protein n=1 Tax=Pseudonocardia endophytica TaxID=401976 RepID=UPI001FB30F77|nr:2'-5' RNA ligase family protein [Pseudonocardia endophytica]